MYNHVDYLENYGRIMQFNKNKIVPVHRWYPFVEGYSREFIISILNEIDTKDILCLEPFSGSGTTALELQNFGITCYSFEVNPLMYLIARVKLENEYDLQRLDYWFDYIVNHRELIECNLKTNFSTLYENEKKSKWNYSTIVAEAIERLRLVVESISEEIYRDLFLVALASILLDVSNLYRNGKCLSYKNKWQEIKLTSTDVYLKFDEKFKNEIRPDINECVSKTTVCNKSLLFNIDSRIGIEKEVSDNSIDLVITSPPYLNSRDYTDTYMLELKTLGFTKTSEEIQNLRRKTLRSHVQIKWDDPTTLNNKILNDTLKELKNREENTETWNDSIIDMVRLYFVDIKQIFNVLYKKMKTNGRIYFNVSNSAYYNVLIDTLEICASIAEEEGFKVIEIRDARYLKTSPQQKETVKKLLEGVIVLEK